MPIIPIPGITDKQVAKKYRDGVAADPSLRTLGTAGTQAAAGNDSRLSDTRVPSAHATTHSSGGSDPITVSNLAGSVAAAQMPALTGDVTTPAGSVATTIAAGAVSLAKQANLAANSIQGNNTGSPATPLALTAAQVRTLLSLVPGTDVQAFSSILAGLAASSGPVSASWTPVVEGASTPGFNTYGVQVGRYIQIGKIVVAWGRFVMSAKSVAMVGNIQIGGLPVTSVNNTNQFGCLTAHAPEQFVFVTFLSGHVGPNSTKIALYKNASGTAATETNLATADLGANAALLFSIIYEAA
jgi:hypothetical protein